MPSRSARVLHVSAFVPDERAAHAGGQAAFQNRLALEREGLEITSLVCTTERRDYAETPGQTIFLQTPATLLYAWGCRLLSGPRFAAASWPLLDTRAHRRFEKRLRMELHRGSYDVVYCEYTQMLLPVWRAVQTMPQKPRVRACVQDLYIQKLLRDNGLRSRLLLGFVARTERRLLQWVDELITLSPKDETLSRLLFDCPNVSTKAFVPPRWVAGVRREASGIAQREVLFFANFDRPENAEALDWFVRDALPEVARRHADVKLVIAGAGSDRVRLPTLGVPVHQLGFLDDPGPAFARCRLAIAPLARGAGVKFKVLEALACGVPVLGTAVALEGITRNELVHEAAREHYAEALNTLLDPPCR